MADIFISYASEDRKAAKALAEAFELNNWSVWWDREIPFGKAFDEVIETAIKNAGCMIVLWSEASVKSAWVRSEASEGNRRGILVPVFLETVDAPLAFRLMHGADLTDWFPGEPSAEFDNLCEHITEVLTTPQKITSGKIEPYKSYLKKFDDRLKQPGLKISAKTLAVVSLFALILGIGGAGFYGYLYMSPGPSVTPVPSPSATPEPSPSSVSDPMNISDLEQAIKNMALANTSPQGDLLTTAFYLPDLGIRVAFVDLSKSDPAGILSGAKVPSGGLVVEIESNKPASIAGLHTFDIILEINGKKIESVDNLRDTLKNIGPGKTEFLIQRPGAKTKLIVDCPNCVRQ